MNALFDNVWQSVSKQQQVHSVNTKKIKLISVTSAQSY
jgi:hypothetical protein